MKVRSVLRKTVISTWFSTVQDVQCCSLILAPLVNMCKGGCENKSALFIILIFHKNKNKY